MFAIETLFSLAALGIAFVGAFVQFMKWRTDLRERKSLAENAATKAEAERDSIMIKGAESALIMMQGMLDVAQMSNEELRKQLRAVEQENQTRIRELEKENHQKDLRILQLEQELQVANYRLASLEQRMTQQERKADG